MFTDEMLCHAAAVSNELFVNAIEATYNPSIIPIPSKKFERKIKKLYHRADHPFFYRTMDRVASVVLAVLLTGSTWLALNVEARAAFLSWIKNIYENSIVYEFLGPHASETVSGFELTGLPDGYVEISSFAVDGIGNVVYSKESDIIIFQYMETLDGSHKTLLVDEYSHETVQIGSIQGDFYRPNDSTQTNELIWIDENLSYAFQLSSYWNKEALISLAYSIVPKFK